MERNLWLAVAAIIVCKGFTGLAQDAAVPLEPPQVRLPEAVILPNGQPVWVQLTPLSTVLNSVDTATAIANQIKNDTRIADDQEAAYREFESIKAKLATLIKRYPHTKTGKAAEDMITRAGLRVAPLGRDDLDGLYPTGTYFGYVPITR